MDDLERVELALRRVAMRPDAANLSLSTALFFVADEIAQLNREKEAEVRKRNDQAG